MDNEHLQGSQGHPLIKLCGLRKLEEIKLCNELKVDFVGFIFAPKSKRYISDDTAASLKAALSPAIKAVGVFVNEDIEHIVELVSSGTIDVVQLHGSESPDYVQKLRDALSKASVQLSSTTIIKAHAIDTYDDIAFAESFPSDYALLDNGKGGTGKTFDWTLSNALNRPYFLAGGLNLDNIKDALEHTKPYAVDVSSGIETDGVKDLLKMRRFVEAVRSCAWPEGHK